MPFPGQTGQRECLILGNGPSLLLHPLRAVPRERVLILGVNQSWRVTADVDAHIAADSDQLRFDDRNASGYGGRAYYEAHAARGTLIHMQQGPPWFGRGVRVDRHDELIFSRRPFERRHKDGCTPRPPLAEDGGVALKLGEGGSTCYVALQCAAPHFDVVWFVGLDMGATAKKFDGAIGFTDRKKGTLTSTGAWSNSQQHDGLWRHVPADVRARVRVIAPSATQVLDVVAWPWPAEAAA